MRHRSGPAAVSARLRAEWCSGIPHTGATQAENSSIHPSVRPELSVLRCSLSCHRVRIFQEEPTLREESVFDERPWPARLNRKLVHPSVHPGWSMLRCSPSCRRVRFVLEEPTPREDSVFDESPWPARLNRKKRPSVRSSGVVGAFGRPKGVERVFLGGSDDHKSHPDSARSEVAEGSSWMKGRFRSSEWPVFA